VKGAPADKNDAGALKSVTFPKVLLPKNVCALLSNATLFDSRVSESGPLLILAALTLVRPDPFAARFPVTERLPGTTTWSLPLARPRAIVLLVATVDSEPMAVANIRSPEPTSARLPSSVFLLPPMFDKPVSAPRNELSEPVLFCPALIPKNALLLPMLFDFPVSTPKYEFLIPNVF